MQSETVTSPPVSPPGELDETYARVVSDSRPFALSRENMMSSTKPEVHNYRIAVGLVLSHGHR